MPSPQHPLVVYATVCSQVVIMLYIIHSLFCFHRVWNFCVCTLFYGVVLGVLSCLAISHPAGEERAGWLLYFNFVVVICVLFLFLTDTSFGIWSVILGIFWSYSLALLLYHFVTVSCYLGNIQTTKTISSTGNKRLNMSNVIHFSPKYMKVLTFIKVSRHFT